MMTEKKVVCPYCMTKLVVQNPYKDKSVLNVICPKCKKKSRVVFKPEDEPMEAHTYLGDSKPQSNTFETQLGKTPTSNVSNGYETSLVNERKRISKVTAHLSCAGVNYPLSEGRNTIGRRSEIIRASIPIMTTDVYMSRRHCIIDVKILRDGSQKAVLYNFENKNSTFIDGVKVEKGDGIILMDGNIITMGDTKIIFSF